MKTENQHVVLFEINKKRCEKWKKWCKLLGTTYRGEVEKSLVDEKVLREMFVAFELHGKTYGLALAEGKSLLLNEKREVNKIHHAKAKECLRRVSKAHILYSVGIDPLQVYPKRKQN